MYRSFTTSCNTRPFRRVRLKPGERGWDETRLSYVSQFGPVEADMLQSRIVLITAPQAALLFLFLLTFLSLITGDKDTISHGQDDGGIISDSSLIRGCALNYFVANVTFCHKSKFL